MKSRACLPLLVLMVSNLRAGAQDQPGPSPTRLFFTIELLSQTGWKAAEPQSVFNQQDRLRFRFRTSVAGYLYILDHSSGGSVSWIYPVASRKSSNHLKAGESVLIPGEEGSFAISGAAGFDTLYWILRSAPLTVPQVTKEQLDSPSTLISRCPEEQPAEKSSAQTACLDTNAGPKALADPTKFKTALGLPDSLVARDLTFESKAKGTEIATNSDGTSSEIIYQVRIAHK